MYLYYRNLHYFLSIQHHTLCHSNQSRGYILCCFYNVLHTVDYSWHHTILHCILLYRKMYTSVKIHWKNHTWEKKINEGIELGVGKILHLTCFTINPGPSRFTYKTHSTLYVTRAVVAIIRTRCITVTTVKTSIFASCFKNELYMCNTRLKKWKLIKRYS